MPVIYDITRLVTRIGRPVPNGIDRVDVAYAKYYLSKDQNALGALIGATGTPRLVARTTALAVVEGIQAGWQENGSAATDPELLRVLGSLDPSLVLPNLRTEPRSSRVRIGMKQFRHDGRIFGQSGLWPGCNIVKHAPRDAIFLNVSQFPIWMPRYWAWHAQRPDIRPVFFLHDLLPIQYPEFFRLFEVQRHIGRLRVITRHAAAVIVASNPSRQALLGHCAANGTQAPRICVAPLDISNEFQPARLALPPGSKRHPYFICIATIEPRKNHLLLLNIWREMTKEYGPDTPRLVLVGSRGWECENVFDMLQRCDALSQSVLITSRLSTPALNQLMSGAAAVLMPTFAEGFGLPVAEALACGIPVVASDIDVFREFNTPLLTLVDPLDGLRWRQEIDRHRTRQSASKIELSLPTPRPALQFRHIDALLQYLG